MPRGDEDIVFTLSDHDDLSASDLSGEEVAPQLKPSTKRKRTNVKGLSKSSKKRKTQDEPEDGSSDEEGVKDDALDPDFEFDLGANSFHDAIEDFDGWGEDGGVVKKAREEGCGYRRHNIEKGVQETQVDTERQVRSDRGRKWRRFYRRR